MRPTKETFNLTGQMAARGPNDPLPVSCSRGGWLGPGLAHQTGIDCCSFLLELGIPCSSSVVYNFSFSLILGSPSHLWSILNFMFLISVGILLC
ncbi:hypothetical protein BJ875DRAFT_76230 [Amylocarpus encephaloides]|uniref:Uncharacterized protein n=1 Tax=Amylocarpus encephaloides TaxID=45428 RepID=A0A9P8C8W1_9HELO|nr:hypothetical protein BJ875DRAFT_76230 [Amylocarpus encephaloides]